MQLCGAAVGGTVGYAVVRNASALGIQFLAFIVLMLSCIPDSYRRIRCRPCACVCFKFDGQPYLYGSFIC